MKMFKSILCVILGIVVLGCEKHVTEPDMSIRNMEDFEAAWILNGWVFSRIFGLRRQKQIFKTE